MNKYLNLFDLKQKVNYNSEILSGLTVAMASRSYRLIAGLSPLTGLYAAFIMGIVTAIFGGRPGMFLTGAMALVFVGLIVALKKIIQRLP